MYAARTHNQSMVWEEKKVSRNENDNKGDTKKKKPKDKKVNKQMPNTRPSSIVWNAAQLMMEKRQPNDVSLNHKRGMYGALSHSHK